MTRRTRIPAMLSQDAVFAARCRGGQAVLELACGTGRAAIPLAQAGHRVVGLDYDAKMLQIARRKRDFVGLADRNLSLVKANVVKFDLRKNSIGWFCCSILFWGLRNWTSRTQFWKTWPGT